MKVLHYYGLILLMFITVLIISFKSEGQSNNSWTLAKSVKWYNSKDWLNGLQLMPHFSTDKQEFANQYHANKKWWDEAFAFLKRSDLETLKPGRYAIDGENVFATVSVGPTKDLDQTKWESHRIYLDIHYVIKGKEKIGIAPVSSAKVIQAYDSTKDIAFYTSEGKYYTSSPNSFFIVSPEDAHRPGVKVDDYEVIKKIVIKIRKAK